MALVLLHEEGLAAPRALCMLALMLLLGPSCLTLLTTRFWLVALQVSIWSARGWVRDAPAGSRAADPAAARASRSPPVSACCQSVTTVMCSGATVQRPGSAGLSSCVRGPCQEEGGCLQQ